LQVYSANEAVQNFLADLADLAGLVPDLDLNSGGDSQTSFLKRYKKAYLHIFFRSEKKVHTPAHFLFQKK
jgi:hypothetical protein